MNVPGAFRSGELIYKIFSGDHSIKKFTKDCGSTSQAASFLMIHP
jgi:hypothetical protein